MDTLTTLWLPTVLSGVVVFIGSFVAWVVLPHHKREWSKLPDEDAFLKALGEWGIEPKQYMFPHAETPEEMKSEEHKRRWMEGPRGSLCVWPGAPNMGMNMLCTFMFYLVASFCIAYVANMALDPGASVLSIFRVVTTVGVLTYCAAGIPNAIWFKRKIAWDLVDGLVYAVLTGLIFALLWP